MPPVVAPISNFETNTTDHSRRSRGSSARASARRPLNAKRVDLAGPTPERLAKEDAPERLADGHYRAPAPIERLFNRGSLDPVPHINSAMYEAALKLRRHFEAAQLIGIKAQDLNRAVSGGGSDSLEGEENWVHHFDVFKKACKAMGWHDAHPHRGAGRIVVAVICHEAGVKDAARLYRPGGSDSNELAKGMDVLREGLFALALVWKFC